MLSESKSRGTNNYYYSPEELRKMDDFKKRRIIKLCPDLWAETFRTLGANNYRLIQAPMYRSIFRCFSDENGIKKGTRVTMKCGRKVWKTETAVSLILWSIFSIPNPTFSVLYASPTMSLTRPFFEKRLRNAIVGLKGGLNSLVSSYSTEKIVIKDSETNMRKFIYGSSTYRDSKSIRGHNVDFVILDEFQSSLVTESVIEETLAQSDYNWMLILGTALYPNDPLDKVWDSSTKGEWDYNKNAWVHKNVPNDGRPFWGFHISQIGHPAHSEESIRQKRIRKTPREFANEVCGETYAGAKKPISQKDFISCFDYDKSLEDDIPGMRKLYMGIDWGERHHWVIVCEPEDVDKRSRLVDFGAISATDASDLEKIYDIIDFYDPYVITADVGSGRRECNELQDKYNDEYDRVRRCEYVPNRSRKPIKYLRRNEKGFVYKYQLDKTAYVEKIITDLKRSKIIIPFREDNDKDRVRKFTRQWCNIEANIEDIRTREKDVVVPKTKYFSKKDDHYFHASLYAILPILEKRDVENMSIQHLDI